VTADIFVVGPTGFHRRLTGRCDIFSVGIEQGPAGKAHATRALLHVLNLTNGSLSITMTDRSYGTPGQVIALAGGETRSIRVDLAQQHGWYDWQFATDGQIWRMAGHLENGMASFSDPVGGGPGPLRLGKSV
jgi:phospholipase C